MYFNKLLHHAILLKGPVILLVLLFLMNTGLPSAIAYPHAHITLAGIALLQMAEAWIVQRREEEGEEDSSPGWMETAILAATLVLCYLFVRFTGGMESRYGPIFLLPILSGSTRYRAGGALLVTFSAVALYGTYYFTDKNVPTEDLPGETLELLINIFFSVFIGVIVSLASLQERTSQRKLRRAADEIASTNVVLREAQENLKAKVAELETMEQAIRRGERLAALGQMSSGLAHEIRTPLGVIQSSAEMLGKKVLAQEPDNRLVSVIVEEIGRINQLVMDFLTFASPPAPTLHAQDLDDVIHRAVRLVETTAEKRGVRIDIRSPGDLHDLPVDEGLLHQCLLNLLMNAIDVMPDGGTIEIEAACKGHGKEVSISVRDSGPGVPPDAESRIFNPFYTTKKNGTGLGLAIVQQIMTMHGGRVEVENAPGKGAVFTLRIPLEPPSSLAAGATPLPEEASI